MSWLIILLPAWLVVAAAAALVIGRSVHAADVIEETNEVTATLSDPYEDDVPNAGGLAGFVMPRQRGTFAGR